MLVRAEARGTCSRLSVCFRHLYFTSKSYIKFKI